MSRKAKLRLGSGVLVVALLGGIGAWFFLDRGGTRAQEGGAAPVPQAIGDIGRFRVGSVLGEERAGFAGRSKLLVFSSAMSPTYAETAACLTTTEVEAELDFFTPILVDEAIEPDVEADLRQRDGIGVLVQGLQGQVLGTLPVGFSCRDLVALLKRVRAAATRPPELSPIYANLLERPVAVVDDMVSRGEGERASRLVDHLREFEGATSPAVAAAESRLGR